MSEWYEIKNQDDIEISADGKTLEILFNTNQFGNQYIEIPIKFITKILVQPSSVCEACGYDHPGINCSDFQ